MKMNNRIIYGAMAAAAVMLGACENAEQDFPDFKYNATYFPYQYPSRVLILGEDEQVDSTAPDNRGEFKIGCTMAGVYANDRSREVEYVIDESLAENLYGGAAEGAASLVLQFSRGRNHGDSEGQHAGVSGHQPHR